MHEFSLAQALLAEVERVRCEHGGTRVKAIRVEVGELAGVEPELLASAVELLLADGPSRGANLAIERVPIEARCQECGSEFRVDGFHFLCPGCGGPRVVVLRGEGLTLRSVTLEKAEHQKMSEPNLQDILRDLHFLRDVPEEDLARLASMARLESYPASVVLFREGAVLNRIFLVVDGTVALEIRGGARGGRRILTVGAGELLGWSPMLGQAPMTATARVLTPARVVSIDAGQLLALCHHQPRFGFLF